MSRRSAERRSELTVAQWRRLEELLPAALELPVDARDAYLDRACEGDAALRAELGALVAAYDAAGILDRPITRRSGEATGASGAGLARGVVVAHYEIQEPLGRGGMGVVYRARDRRLGRTVALKFLPPALSADARAKRRFLAEARAAAALDHPNVCTVHEIGETDEGQLFIAMAFVEGQSLRQAIDRGPLAVAQAVDIARQIAAALQCAHARGIVHRDVKPANVMLASDGVVKLVDFGVAKLEDSTLTGAGATPGTVAYMSPEQVRGEQVDHRTDLWSLGVVLYEMLAGARPFTGATDAMIYRAIAESAPPPVRSRRTDVPTELESVVARALANDRERRFQSAEEMREALRLVREGVPPAAPGRRLSRRALASIVTAAILVAAAGTLAGLSMWRRAETRWAAASLPRIERLAGQGRHVEAYALAERAERALPGDPELRRLIGVITDRVTVLSQPAGASVWLRRVAEDGSLAPDSVPAGATPVRGLRVPRADYRVDIRKDGFVPVARIASSALNRAEASLGVSPAVTIDVPLRESGKVPEGMLFVPGSEYRLVGRGAPTRASVTLPDFYIDAHEATNEDYRKFVHAGGYGDSTYWRHAFILDGRTLSWREAMRRLVDRTGLPGPRGWTGQDFAPGQARHPVTGVTWYEAAAYAAFVGKRLPTIFEWEKAARDGRYTHFEGVVMPWGLADLARGIARRANFGGSAPEAVDSHPSGISPYGAYDMAGNVEEWIANPAGEKRFITGGSWDDPIYIFSDFLPVSGFHASPSLGFRCARSAGGATGNSGGFEIPAGAGTPEYRPVDERTYHSLLRHYAYDRAPLDARVAARVTTPEWTRETIRIAGPWRDPTVLYLYLPLRAARPLQTVIFVPPSNTFFEASVPDETERLMGPHVKAGRAVLAVQMKGMVGRPWDAGRPAPAPSSVQFRQELVLHATELRRGIDYLETRPDIDRTRLAYVAVSWGSGSRLAFAAVEPRLRSVVLIGGGFDERFVHALPEARAINFAPRIAAPKLLLNGRYDEEHPWDACALPLWRLLREPKRLTLVESGHVPPAEARVPAINAWLDETLGPVR
jgi:eukaryotic-like serine/threonine-protein kinase